MENEKVAAEKKRKKRKGKSGRTVIVLIVVLAALLGGFFLYKKIAAHSKVENQYRRVVPDAGNLLAQQAIADVFCVNGDSEADGHQFRAHGVQLPVTEGHLRGDIPGGRRSHRGEL